MRLVPILGVACFAVAATASAEPLFRNIRGFYGGLAFVGDIPWQNRPTFQQVVQIR